MERGIPHIFRINLMVSVVKKILMLIVLTRQVNLISSVPEVIRMRIQMWIQNIWRVAQSGVWVNPSLLMMQNWRREISWDWVNLIRVEEVEVVDCTKRGLIKSESTDDINVVEGNLLRLDKPTQLKRSKF